MVERSLRYITQLAFSVVQGTFLEAPNGARPGAQVLTPHPVSFVSLVRYSKFWYRPKSILQTVLCVSLGVGAEHLA